MEEWGHLTGLSTAKWKRGLACRYKEREARGSAGAQFAFPSPFLLGALWGELEGGRAGQKPKGWVPYSLSSAGT